MLNEASGTEKRLSTRPCWGFRSMMAAGLVSDFGSVGIKSDEDLPSMIFMSDLTVAKRLDKISLASTSPLAILGTVPISSASTSLQTSIQMRLRSISMPLPSTMPVR